MVEWANDKKIYMDIINQVVRLFPMDKQVF